jgi:hypothetical protein
MRPRRVLAGAMVAAWSKTAVAAIPLVLDQPAAVADTTATPAPTTCVVAPPRVAIDIVQGLGRFNNQWKAHASSVGFRTLCSGTLFLEVSPGGLGGPWQILGSQHTAIVPSTDYKRADVQSPCTVTGDYRAVFESDDGSFKRSAGFPFVVTSSGCAYPPIGINPGW